MAKKEGVKRALGVSSELIKMLTDLAGQVEKLSDDADDLRVLENNEPLLKRVAQVITRAARLKKSFLVHTNRAPHHIQMWFKRFPVILPGDNKEHDLLAAVKMENYRLATVQELVRFWTSYGDILADETDLNIFGEKCQSSADPSDFWVLNKFGVTHKVISPTDDENRLFAVIIDITS